MSIKKNIWIKVIDMNTRMITQNSFNLKEELGFTNILQDYFIHYELKHD